MCVPSPMQENPEQRETADKMLEAIKKKYGAVPFVNQVTAQRPDIFIPAVKYSKAVLEVDEVLDKKTRCLVAVGAATALGGQYCVNVQMDHAVQYGATKDEVFEAIMIGSYMAMTRAQSYALREFDKKFPRPDSGE